MSARRTASLVCGVALVAAAAAGASPKWALPVQISSPDRALGPNLAADARGDALVVWDQEVGSVCPSDPAALECIHVVSAVSRTHGSASWTAPLDIRHPGVGSRPRAAIAPSGNAAILFVHDIGADRVVQATYRHGFDGAWPEPNDISDSVHEVRTHAVAMDAADDVVGAWAERTDTGVVVRAASRDAASGVWGSAMPLSQGGNVTAGPALAVTASGEALAAWVEDGNVRVASGQAAAGSWGGSVAISGGAAVNGEPSLAVNAAGDAAVVWSGPGAVRAAFRPHGAGWTAASTVATAPGNGDEQPSIGVDAAGNAVAVWLAGTVRAAAWRRASSTWSAAVDLSAAGAGDPRVAVNPAGDAVALWSAATTHVLRAALRPAASGDWRRKVNVSAGPATSIPSVALNSDGSAIAVWNRNPSGTAFTVEAADLRAGGPFLTQIVIPARARVGASALFSVVPVPWAVPLVGKPVWHFGDGKSVAAFRVKRAYAKAGRYTVTISASDAAGGTSTTSATIVVTA